MISPPARSHRPAMSTAALLLLWAMTTGSAGQLPPKPYFPEPGHWRREQPQAAGLDKTALAEAVAFAVAHENPGTKDLAVAIVDQFRNETPYNTLIGPTRPRAAANGLIIHRGAIVAEWGDTARADMAFSVTKTFLSTVVGLAVDRGNIRDVTDRVAGYMPSGVDLFTSEHNASITWEHLLRQTSDWSGTLWGKPDWADRPPRGQSPAEWEKRPLNEPGTVYVYNDARVNVLALSTLYVLKKALPDVLKDAIMDPIGASDTWRWEGYDNSWVTIGESRIQSVSGGGHFGGGMFISAVDMARFGYLFLRHGNWNGGQLISRKWLDLARSPGPANPGYGFCNWFLNNPQKLPDGSDGPLPFPSAPRSSVTFQGNGVNVIYLDWDHDLVAVVRWMDSNRSVDQFIGKVIQAIR